MIELSLLIIYCIGFGITGRLIWQFDVKRDNSTTSMLVFAAFLWPLTMVIIIGDIIGKGILKLFGQKIRD